MSTNQMVLPEDWVDTIRLCELRFTQAFETISVMTGIPTDKIPPLSEMSTEVQDYMEEVASEFESDDVTLWMNWRNSGRPELVKSQTVEEFLTKTMGVSIAPETAEPVQAEIELDRIPEPRPATAERDADRLARLMAYLRNNPDWESIDPISRGNLFDEANAILQETFTSEDDEARALEIATFRAKRRGRSSWADTPAESQEWLLSDARALVAVGF